LPASLLRQSRRALCDQKSPQGTCHLRFSQFENGIPASEQRHHFLPKRHDVFRRGRTAKADRKVLSLSGARWLLIGWPRGKPAGLDGQIYHGLSRPRHRVPAYRGPGMTQFPHDPGAEMRELFFETSQELLQSLNDDALKLEKAPNDPGIIRSLRRTV